MPLMIANRRLQAKGKAILLSYSADCNQCPLSAAEIARRVWAFLSSLFLSNQPFSLVDRQFRQNPNVGVCNPFAHDTPSNGSKSLNVLNYSKSCRLHNNFRFHSDKLKLSLIVDG